MREMIRRWRFEISMAGVVGLVLAAGGFACGGGSSGTPSPPPPPAPVEIITICTGSPVPSGFVKINDNWDPTSCGSPSSITYNVSTYQRYDNKPVGTYMNICAGGIPTGWVLNNTHWDPTSCGHPSSISDNIYSIRRIS